MIFKRISKKDVNGGSLNRGKLFNFEYQMLSHLLELSFCCYGSELCSYIVCVDKSINLNVFNQQIYTGAINSPLGITVKLIRILF